MTGSERSAAAALIEHDYDVYLPLARQFTGRRSDAIEAPLFPGYLFVRGSSSRSRLAAITSLPGVLCWVQFDGRVPTLSAEDIEELAGRVESINRNGGVWRQYVPGDRVSVRLGTMDGSAEVQESPISPHEPVNVLLDFMGQQVRASVPWSSIRLAKDADDWTGDSSVSHETLRRRRTRGRGRRIKYGDGPGYRQLTTIQ